MKSFLLVFVLSVALCMLNSSLLEAENTWEKIPSPPEASVLDFDIDNSGTIYACDRGFYSSTDKGLTWNSHYYMKYGSNTWLLNEIPEYFYRILVLKDGSILVLIEEQRKSRLDKSDTVIRYLGDSPFKSAYAICDAPGGRLYAVSGNLYYSDDRGTTWTQANYELLAFTSTDVTVDGKGRIFVSEDNGLHCLWLEDNVYKYKHITVENSVTVKCLNFKHDIWYACTNNGLFYSKDNGETWQQNSTLGNHDIKCIEIDTQGRIFLGSNRHGVIYSLDTGATWNKFNAFNKQTVNRIKVRGDDLYVATNRGFWYSSNSGTTWENRFRGMFPYFCKTLAFDNNVNIVTATADNVYRSTNEGRSWTGLMDTLAENDTYNYNIIEVATDAQSNIYIRSIEEGLHRYNNATSTWEKISIEGTTIINFVKDTVGNLYCFDNTGNITKILTNGSIEHHTFSYYSDYNRIRCNADNSISFFAPDGLHVSTDGCQSWSVIPVVYPNDISDNSINEYIIKGDTAIIVTNAAGSLYYSKDRFQTWTQISQDFLQLRFRSLKYVEGKIWMTCQRGFFTSTNWGETWTNVSGELFFNLGTEYEKNPVLLDLDWVGRLYTSFYNGFFHTVNKITPVKDEYVTKSTFNVYPNPANSALSLDLSAYTDKRIDIILSDLGGNIIKEYHSVFATSNKDFAIPLTEIPISSSTIIVTVKSGNSSVSEKVVFSR